MGLGRGISTALIDLMVGEIEVRSRPREGSRFRVGVPIVALATAADEVSQAAELDVSVSDQPLRILLVEDNATNRKVVELILAPAGVDLVSAENGALGLEAWRHGSFDVVLMDMQMPVMDGLSAVRAIRAEENAAPGRTRTPIAMLSANAMQHHQLESLAAGADLHIAKPITPASLLAGIEAALDGAAREAA